ncbi:uncharacterized protein J3R85_016585 [Psidium guajava]|nr:uncharacterized protein J3R85_016585 [Psidium guajava]
MLHNSGKWATLPSPPKLPNLLTTLEQPLASARTKSTLGARRPCKSCPHNTSVPCAARRRSVRHGGGGGGEEEDKEDRGDGEEHGRNEEIAMLELYSQSARGEALVVHAAVDGEEVEVLIYKGFSSSLSFGTSPDPSKSILPAKARSSRSTESKDLSTLLISSTLRKGRRGNISSNFSPPHENTLAISIFFPSEERVQLNFFGFSKDCISSFFCANLQ